jgi:two-component system NtrC family response regulator
VVTLKLPPLRERENDIPLLAQAFLQKFASENKKEAPKFTAQALRALCHHNWPGNVRELENRIKRAVIMAEGSRVTPEDLELHETSATSTDRNLKEAREAVEREMVLQALKKHSGKISPAAADLGISRPTLYELIDKLGLKRD